MPTIKYLKMSQVPTVSFSGTESPTHVANYECEVDESVPSDFAVAMCQGIAGSGLPTGAHKLPQLGARLLWDNGELIEDIGQTSAQFQIDHPNGYADFGATVLQIVGTPRRDNCHHDIKVTWRSPDGQGAGFDRKAMIDAINDRTHELPLWKTPFDQAGLISAIQNAICDVKVDYFTRTLSHPGLSYLVTGVTPAGTRTAVFNPVGEPVEQPPLTERVRVYTMMMPTTNANMADGFESIYQNTVNSDTFTLEGQLNGVHHARFLSATCSDPITRGKLTYRRTSWKVEVANRPYYRKILHTGTFYKTATFDQDLSDFGFPIGQIYPLKANGDKALTTSEQAEELRLDYDEVSYAGLIPPPTPTPTP